jgi:hypothetical protein
MKYYLKEDRERECWRVLSTESQDHDGDGAHTWIADVYDPTDAQCITDLLNKQTKEGE